ncbi:MAG: M24 family metallopeptidase [Lacrimispora saccharolytica]
MTNLDMQNLNRETMKYLKKNITVGMSLPEIRNICEKFMLENGADSFWYWNVGAFVFSGDETTVSVSGRTYQTSERIIGNNDIITVDLSPQNNNVWGDYARTIIIENGKVIENTEDIHNNEWKQGVQMEQYLHKLLIENVTVNMTFEELFYYINDIISEHGFINLDFAGNLGHSIVENKDDRIYIEKGNKAKLSEVKMFTFEPHISTPDSKYGYKREDIYYFKKGKLVKL